MEAKTSATLSSWTAAIYIFNLIVGTGALALPAAFQMAGWLLGTVLLTLLGLTSYITATWVMEAMSACNGLLTVEERAARQRIVSSDDEDEEAEDSASDGDNSRVAGRGVLAAAVPPAAVGRNYFDASDEEEDDDDDNEGNYDDRNHLVRQNMVGQVDVTDYGSGSEPIVSRQSVFNLNKQLEMAKMADILYNKFGKVCFSLCIILYLYGDLSIYCTAIAKSLRDVTCTARPGENGNSSSSSGNCTENNSSLDYTTICWEASTLTRQDTYRIYVACFLCLLGPFAFFNVTKTKYLQLATTFLRWTAFTSMVVLASMRIADSTAEHGVPKTYDLNAIPPVFGVSVYAFMCHHSIPSLISPVKKKSSLGLTLAADYILIAGFYLILAFTGIFAFPTIPDLYTLAFKPDRCSDQSAVMQAVEYFLALFPVFTLSTNFPIIAITLRNNLDSMFSDLSCFPLTGRRAKLRRVIFPLLAILPPALIALITENLGILVTVTGAYAGAGIQYVIPATLVWLGRRRITALRRITRTTQLKNPHTSPFSHTVFVVLVLAWSLLAVGIVTANFIIAAL